MKINLGFIVTAMIAIIISGLCKVFSYWVLNDPQTFGMEVFRSLPTIRHVEEIALILSVGLICLGLLTGKPAADQFKAKRQENYPNPFVDDSFWSRQ